MPDIAPPDTIRSLCHCGKWRSANQRSYSKRTANHGFHEITSLNQSA
jgi:hypothetical protein